MANFSLFPIIDGNPVDVVQQLGSTVFYRLDTIFSATAASLTGPSAPPSRSGFVTGTDLTGSFEGGVGRFSGGTVTGIDLIRDSDSTVFVGMTGLSISATALGEFLIDDNAAGLAAVLLRGNDRIITSTGNDVVQGMRGADDMFGEAGDDQLFGGRGADSLHGWAGQDTLTGGAGRDAFVFEIAPSAANADGITDFRSGVDRIEIDNAFFRRAPAEGDLRAGRFIEGTAATTAAHRVVFDSATGQVFWDRDGVGSAAAELFVTLQVGASLTFSDIAII